MRTSAAVIIESQQQSAIERLQEFLQERKTATQAVVSLAEFEQHLHELISLVECEAIGAELKKFDVDVPAVEIAGRMYKQVLRSESTYLCAGGEVRVERSLYRAKGSERVVVPCPIGKLVRRWDEFVHRSI